jgi:hypothetical protein
MFRSDMELGDLIESALSKIGLDSVKIESWLGRPCGCRERRDKLNALSAWARRVVGGKVDRAKEYLNAIISEQSTKGRHRW